MKSTFKMGNRNENDAFERNILTTPKTPDWYMNSIENTRNFTSTPERKWIEKKKQKLVTMTVVYGVEP